MFGCIRHIRRKSSPSKDRTPHSLAVVGLGSGPYIFFTHCTNTSSFVVRASQEGDSL